MNLKLQKGGMVLKKKFVKTCSSLMLLILSFNCNKVFAINNEEIQNEIDSNNKVIEELEKEKEEVKEELKEEEQALKELELSIESKKQDLLRVRENVNLYQGEIDILQTDIDSIEEKIKFIEDEILDKENMVKRLIEEQEVQQGLLSNRLRNYYKMDISSQYMYMLLNSENIFDLFNNINNISKLIQLDNELIKNKKKNELKIAEEINDIEKSLSEQEELRQAIVNKQLELIDKQREFIAIKEKEENEMYELQILEGEKSNLIASLEGIENSLENKIEDLLSYNEELQRELDKIFDNIDSGANSVVPPSSENDSGFLRPVNGVITCEFGPRINPVTFVPGFHNGIDYAGNTGESIRATKSGVVEYSGWIEGYGYTIILNHGNGVTSLYAHASQLIVSVGESVSQGDTVALIGSTGMSTGPHLHFEIRINGQAVDPFGYIPY